MSDVVERRNMGHVRCENCGATCTVWEAPKTGRLSYTCNGCGSQFMARTSDSMRHLLDRVLKLKRENDKENSHGQSEERSSEQRQPKQAGSGVLDWEW